MKNLVSQLARGGADLMPADLEADLNEQISQESMSQLMEEAPQNFKEGEVVRGRIVGINDNRVSVDIGYKSEGVVDLGEFAEGESTAIGTAYDFYIETPENDHGAPNLSKIKADRIKNWEHVQAVYDNDGIIEGVITRRVKGGLKVDVGVDAFMPASQLTFRPTGDLDRYIGEKMEVKIVKLTRRRRNVVVSRRRLLEEQREIEKQHLLNASKSTGLSKVKLKILPTSAPLWTSGASMVCCM